MVLGCFALLLGCDGYFALGQPVPSQSWVLLANVTVTRAAMFGPCGPCGGGPGGDGGLSAELSVHEGPLNVSSDLNCVSGYYCNGTSCVPKLVDGSACSGASQCQSGNCIDSYCCNSACTGSCNACNLLGSEGICSVVPDGDPGNPTCAPYLCDGLFATCPTSCVTDADCAGGYSCAGGVCSGGGCTTNHVLDPSFEGGTPNASWNEASTNFGSPLCTDADCGSGGGTGPHTGTWWAWFGGISGAYELATVDQIVTIPTGTATLSFWFELPACATSGVDTFVISIDGTPVFSTDNSDPVCDVVGYVLHAVDVTAWADGLTHTLLLRGETFGGTGGPSSTRITNFMVDDIDIEVCN